MKGIWRPLFRPRLFCEHDRTLEKPVSDIMFDFNNLKFIFTQFKSQEEGGFISWKGSFEIMKNGVLICHTNEIKISGIDFKGNLKKLKQQWIKDATAIETLDIGNYLQRNIFFVFFWCA